MSSPGGWDGMGKGHRSSVSFNWNIILLVMSHASDVHVCLLQLASNGYPRRQEPAGEGLGSQWYAWNIFYKKIYIIIIIIMFFHNNVMDLYNWSCSFHRVQIRQGPHPHRHRRGLPRSRSVWLWLNPLVVFLNIFTFKESGFGFL